MSAKPQPIPTVIVGTTTAASDEAVARFLERFLAAEQPGTTWTARLCRPAQTGAVRGAHSSPVLADPRLERAA